MAMIAEKNQQTQNKNQKLYL